MVKDALQLKKVANRHNAIYGLPLKKLRMEIIWSSRISVLNALGTSWLKITFEPFSDFNFKKDARRKKFKARFVECPFCYLLKDREMITAILAPKRSIFEINIDIILLQTEEKN